MNRREFLSVALLASRRAMVGASSRALPAEQAGFFRTAECHGRWWFITPEDEVFFSLGLNHIDSAPLRYGEAGDLWRRKYGNSMERWLKESVRSDLCTWGFTSVGWVQEVVTRGPDQSPALTEFHIRGVSMAGPALLPSACLCRFPPVGGRDAAHRLFQRGFRGLVRLCRL